MNTDIDDAEFDNLTAALRDEFAGLTYDATLHLPARTSSLVKGGAVALAVGLVATVAYNRSDEHAAWAATPKAVSTADVATIEKLCAENLAAPDGSVHVRELPPLVSVDARGARVLAVFGSSPASAGTVRVFSECVLHWEDGRLVLDPRPAITVAVPAITGTAGLSVDLTSIVQLTPAEDKIVFAMGTVGRDVTRVVLSGAGGPSAEATVEAGRYSIWWPRSTYAGPTKVTAYRADGTSVATLALPDYSNVTMCAFDHAPTTPTSGPMSIPIENCDN